MDNTPLERLKRKLYENAPSPLEERPSGELHLNKPALAANRWGEVKERSFFARNIWFIIIALFILASAGTFLYFGLTSFSEDKVALTIDGTKTVAGAGISSWRVSIVNSNRVDLEGATLIFVYPANVLPLEDRYASNLRSEVPLGIIGAKGNVAREFKARILGSDKEVKKVDATLTYQLKGISRTLSKEAQFETTIQQSPLALRVDAPGEVPSGGEVNWRVTYQNASDFDFSNLRLRVEYPDGFTFVSASTPPSHGFDEWGTLVVKAGQENSIEVHGRIKGDADEKKVFKASMELIKEGETPILLGDAVATSTIIRIPLNFTLSVKGPRGYATTAHAGDTLRYTLSYQNNFSEPIDNVTVNATLVGDMVDQGTIQSNGEVSFAEGRVKWDKNSIIPFRRLAPGESGDLWVEAKLKNTFPINTFSDKNFTVQLVASITSDSPPITLTSQEVMHQADVVLPLSTQVIFKREGVTAGFSPGPLPPKVGEKTMYDVTWRVSNSANDFQNVVIKASLPAWASFEGTQKVNFAASGLTYDDATRTVFWTIDRIPSTTGIILPTYQATFRVSITPRPDQVGKAIDFIGASSLEGRDAFTQEAITLTAPAIKTDIDGNFLPYKAEVTQ